MTIEISNIADSAVKDTGDSSSAAATKNNGPQDITSTKPSAGEERVSLTSSATKLRELAAKIDNLPVVDTQRVTNVQRAMATGTFQVNEANAADNMLAMEKSFSK